MYKFGSYAVFFCIKLLKDEITPEFRGTSESRFSFILSIENHQTVEKRKTVHLLDFCGVTEIELQSLLRDLFLNAFRLITDGR